MDKSFDDYEIAGLEAMTANNRNNYVSAINERNSSRPVQSVKYTGHIDKSKRNKLSNKK